MEKKEKAKALFLANYNCAQAIAGAYADLCGITTEQAAKLSSSFGGGFFRCRKSLCGALSGMGLVLGSLFYPDSEDPDEKKIFMERFGKTLKKFEDKYGGINCCDLIKPVEKAEKDLTAATQEDYERRPCLVYVLECIDLIEEELKKE